MNQRKRILLIPSDLQGVGNWRNIWPAKSINSNYGDDFEVELNSEVNCDDIEYLTKFDIIHFHRQLGDFAKFPELSKKLRDVGVVLIMDIDDYWQPAMTHPLYEIVKRDKLTEKILNNLKHVDCVTTTTEIFKKEVLKYNPNIQVIPNAIDMTHNMWKSESVENKSGKCRFGFAGGSSHYHDLLLMKDSIDKLNSSQEVADKYQFVMCGYDIRGTITELLPNGQNNIRTIKPQESIWNNFERIFTSDYSLIKNKEYVDYLKSIKKEDYSNQEMENYIRRWTLPLSQYGKHYDYFDVSLAPLEQVERYKELKTGEIVNELDQRPGTIKTRTHTFNKVKSELKIIEAGMKKKVLIAQDFGIYKEFIKNGENGILVSDDKKGWYKAMKELTLNPDLREKLANNLHEFVKDKYELKNVTGDRVKFYKQILKDKKEGKLEEISLQRDKMNAPKPIIENNVFKTNSKIGNLSPMQQTRQLEKVLHQTSLRYANLKK